MPRCAGMSLLGCVIMRGFCPTRSPRFSPSTVVTRFTPRASANSLVVLFSSLYRSIYISRRDSTLKVLVSTLRVSSKNLATFPFTDCWMSHASREARTRSVPARPDLRLAGRGLRLACILAGRSLSRDRVGPWTSPRMDPWVSETRI